MTATTGKTLTFTTPKRDRELRPIPVELCGHELVLHRPKDTTIYFASQISADTASEGDRAMSILQFVEGVLDPATRHEFWNWAIAGEINLAAVLEMISGAMERWTDWDPKNTAPIVIEFEPSPWNPDPIEVVNEDLDIHWTCSPPSDLIVACVASSLATGAEIGQQAWGIGIFMDAALSQADAMVAAQRMRNRDDDLELEDIAAMVGQLLEEWKPPTNRKDRRDRAKASRTTSTSTRTSNRSTSSRATAKKPAARKPR